MVLIWCHEKDEVSIARTLGDDHRCMRRRLPPACQGCCWKWRRGWQACMASGTAFFGLASLEGANDLLHMLPGVQNKLGQTALHRTETWGVHLWWSKGCCMS